MVAAAAVRTGCEFCVTLDADALPEGGGARSKPSCPLVAARHGGNRRGYETHLISPLLHAMRFLAGTMVFSVLFAARLHS
jgi:hypothetical protein